MRQLCHLGLCGHDGVAECAEATQCQSTHCVTLKGELEAAMRRCALEETDDMAALDAKSALDALIAELQRAEPTAAAQLDAERWERQLDVDLVREVRDTMRELNITKAPLFIVGDSGKGNTCKGYSPVSHQGVIDRLKGFGMLVVEPEHNSSKCCRSCGAETSFVRVAEEIRSKWCTNPLCRQFLRPTDRDEAASLVFLRNLLERLINGSQATSVWSKGGKPISYHSTGRPTSPPLYFARVTDLL